MRTMGWVVFLMAAGAVSACGSKGSGNGAGGSGGAPKVAPTGNATAEQVAEESRGDVDCPAPIKTPARPANAPVDDVVGVRPGLTYAEAANLVLCSHDLMVVHDENSRGINIQTYGQTIRQGFTARFAEPRVEKTSKQIMQEMQDDMIARSGNAVRQDMKPGQSKWYVGTMGLPGEERVISAAREEWFAEGKNPTVDSVVQALIQKYGQPTRNQLGGNQKYLYWAYDPSGRPITETSPLYNSCSGNASPDGGANYSADCGIVVMAIVFPMPDNPSLARYMQVGVVDQAGGYERLEKTEQALQKMDADRKAREVQDASKNAAKPQL